MKITRHIINTILFVAFRFLRHNSRNVHNEGNFSLFQMKLVCLEKLAPHILS